MERLVIPEEGGYPPVFAYVGETKELAGEKAKEKQRETVKRSRDQTGEGFAGGHRPAGADTSQPIVPHYLSTVNRYS